MEIRRNSPRFENSIASVQVEEKVRRLVQMRLLICRKESDGLIRIQTIQVDVLQLITKQFYFLNSEIEVRGIDASLKYELGTTDLGNQIMVTDTRSVINTIKAENLVFYIDVERVTGNYLADIKVEGLPETSSVSFRIPQIDVIITEGTTP